MRGRPPLPENMKVHRFQFVAPIKFIEELDLLRGDIPRSRFIIKSVEEYMREIKGYKSRRINKKGDKTLEASVTEDGTSPIAAEGLDVNDREQRPK